MTDINALDYFPEDTPAHMKPAWVGALFFAMQDNKIIERFIKENETELSMLLSEFPETKIFIEWFNKNIWGVMPK